MCVNTIFFSCCINFLKKDMEACKRKLADLLTDFLFAVSVLIRWNVHIINIRIDFCVEYELKKTILRTKRQLRARNRIFVRTVSLIINYLAIGCVQVINLSYML